MQLLARCLNISLNKKYISVHYLVVGWLCYLKVYKDGYGKRRKIYIMYAREEEKVTYYIICIKKTFRLKFSKGYRCRLRISKT